MEAELEQVSVFDHSRVGSQVVGLRNCRVLVAEVDSCQIAVVAVAVVELRMLDRRSLLHSLKPVEAQHACSSP